MRDSFVFHADYICDLPDEYKTRFAMYSIKYALNDERPQLEGLELSLWKKIARRIDAESAKYREIQEKRREAARKRYADKQKNQEEKQSDKKKFEKACVRTWEQRQDVRAGPVPDDKILL